MGIHQHYQAYGGRGPTCVRTGLSLGLLATLLIMLRIYVRLRMNRRGTAALIWAIVAWVSDYSSGLPELQHNTRMTNPWQRR